MRGHDYDVSAVCPHCGRPNDTQMAMTDGGAPSPGDVSMCIGCAGLAIFTDTGMRKATPEEMAELIAEPGIREAIALVTGIRP